MIIDEMTDTVYKNKKACLQLSNDESKSTEGAKHHKIWFYQWLCNYKNYFANLNSKL